MMPHAALNYFSKATLPLLPLPRLHIAELISSISTGRTAGQANMTSKLDFIYARGLLGKKRRKEGHTLGLHDDLLLSHLVRRAC